MTVTRSTLPVEIRGTVTIAPVEIRGTAGIAPVEVATFEMPELYRS